MRRTIHVILTGNLILCLITFISYFSPYTDAADSAIMPILGLTYSGQILFHFGFAIVWFFIRPRFSLISIPFLILEIFLFHHFLNFQFNGDGVGHDKTFVVASLNMQFSKSLIDADQSEIDEFINFLTKHDDIDVLCVQECGWRSMEYIDKSMNFGYQHSVEGKFVRIYSNYPIIKKGILNSGFTGANTCLWVDLIVNSDTTRVYNTHLESNRHDGIVPEVIDQESPEKINRFAWLGILKHYHLFSFKRSIQAQMIRKHASTSPYPSIICGDLNDVPLSRVYHNIGYQLSDTFKKRGSGMGGSLKGIIPGLRIDYVFTNPKIEVRSYKMFKETFSDHFMVKTKLSL